MTERTAARPGALIEKREFDTAFYVVLIGIFVTCAIPWYVRIVQLDLVGLARALLILSVAYGSLSLLIERTGRERHVRPALIFLEAAGLTSIGVVWLFAGASAAPTFVAFFMVLCGVTAQLHGMPRALALAIAGVGASGSIAAVASPDLAWYLVRLGVPIDVLAGRPGATGRSSEPGSITSPSVTVLALSAALVAAVILIVLSVRIRRSLRGVRGSDLETPVESLLDSVGTPTVVVDAREGIVRSWSRSFVNQMLLDEVPAGRRLGDLLGLEQVEDLETLLNRGGERHHAHYTVRGENRMGTILGRRMELEGVECVILTFEERIGTGALEEAGENARSALLILDDDGRIRFANRAARESFGVSEGMPVAGLFPLEPGSGWWNTESRGEEVVVAGKRFEREVTRTPSCDAREAMWVIRLAAWDRWLEG